MTCNEIKAQLGPYADEELPAVDAQRIRLHLATCDQCRAEAAAIRELAAAIGEGPAPQVPHMLWTAIERRLSGRATGSRPPQGLRRVRPAMRVAAVIALAVGLGGLILFTQHSENTAEASTIDFGVILDAFPLDPQRALSRFLTRYHGAEIAPAQARSFAPDLDFEAPAVLPGGFQRSNLYGLRFGSSPGVAARYERSGELLVAIFHPTVHPEQFGTHKDYPCVVGDHRGHAVAVGDWRLVHVTDPVTCHCVLSRLGEAELAPVLTAVAPRSKPSASADHKHDSGDPLRHP